MFDTILSECIEKEVISPIDVHFSKMVMQRASLDPCHGIQVIFTLLFACSRQGHICVELDQLGPLLAPTDKQLSKQLEKFIEEIKKEVTSTLLNKTDFPIQLDGNRLYLQKNWYYESSLLMDLKRLLSHENASDLNFKAPKQLNFLQAKAFEMALQKQFAIISGGPGCGKTFVASQILSELCQKRHGQVIVAAPTGKAVENIRQSITLPADVNVDFTTLHRLLKIKPLSGLINEPANCLNADILIIDECSMIDMQIMVKLFSVIHSHTKILLLGDPNQLPPVEAGTIFSDLCSIQQIPRIHLEECLRVESLDVLRLANNVMNESPEKVIEFLENQTSMHIQYQPLSRLTETFLQKYALERLFINPSEDQWKGIQQIYGSTQILCSHQKGHFGAHSINYRIQTELEAQLSLGDTIMHPILVTENCPKLNIMNGTQGLWIKYFGEGKDQCIFEIEGKNVIYPIEYLPSFELAYAITIHKSQGSEYDHIFIVLTNEFSPFGKEALYTALTRCKKSLGIFANKETLLEMLSFSALKHSGLNDRMHAALV